jgi:Histidine kinase-like ATPase domain
MTGDAFPAQPDGRAGRAGQARADPLGPPGPPGPILDQQFDSGSLYALRATVHAHAMRAGLSEHRAGEVVLAVHELAANVITHGTGRGCLRMWDLAGTLRCEILDSCAAGAAGSAGAAGAPGSAGAGGDPGEAPGGWPIAYGHGLWLARQIADRLDLRAGPGGTQAIAVFALPRARQH